MTDKLIVTHRDGTAERVALHSLRYRRKKARDAKPRLIGFLTQQDAMHIALNPEAAQNGYVDADTLVRGVETVETLQVRDGENRLVAELHRRDVEAMVPVTAGNVPLSEALEAEAVTIEDELA